MPGEEGGLEVGVGRVVAVEFGEVDVVVREAFGVGVLAPVLLLHVDEVRAFFLREGTPVAADRGVGACCEGGGGEEGEGEEGLGEHGE